MDKIRVIIVDDHPIFRQGVADAFSLEPDIDVITQADSGEAGLELIRAHQPDVAILDINLPGMNGQQVTRQITAEKLPTRVILLTAYADAGQKIQGLLQGANAFCTKDIQPELLAQVVRVVVNGNYWIDRKEYDPGEIRRLLDRQTGGEMFEPSDISKVSEPLSAREMEILTYITKGMSNKEIAARLDISHQTVKNHVTSILHKLGVNDRTQATLAAFKYGWVRFDE
ncbi:MAG: response regulator transcription factor [Anaerolineales bacterium]|nr:response regulator transcription factor [Anaerolineales bacterium]